MRVMNIMGAEAAHFLLHNNDGDPCRPARSPHASAPSCSSPLGPLFSLCPGRLAPFGLAGWLARSARVRPLEAACSRVTLPTAQCSAARTRPKVRRPQKWPTQTRYPLPNAARRQCSAVIARSSVLRVCRQTESPRLKSPIPAIFAQLLAHTPPIIQGHLLVARSPSPNGDRNGKDPPNGPTPAPDPSQTRPLFPRGQQAAEWNGAGGRET